MPAGSNQKRERQYEHIKESYEQRGTSEDKAEELAARTVNKQRAEAGETKGAKSGSSKKDGSRSSSSKSTSGSTRAGGTKSGGGSKSGGSKKS